ncbi:Sushi, von Willebrand factor type A, EGF and pentraxin domain-containing protein 1 [Nymphon striatum]|nr:Sushi, von Willebrand factor type A, EGF and pentraxin domain-containing protein 1 [Nymphon striatum]
MRVTKIVSILLIVVTIAYCSKKRKLKWKQRLDTLTNKKFMQGKSDLVFLLDRSGSVGAANFEIEKGFVESLLTNFVVAENATRVAVITYSRSTKLHIDYIKSPKNKCFLSEELQEVTYEGSEQTNTAAALLKAQEVLRNARKNVNKVIILLSDGISTAGKNPVDVAKILKKNNVEIFTFAIGRFLKVELDSIATDANHTFNVVNFRQFRKLARRIRGGNFFGFMNKSVYPCLSGTIVPLCLAFIDYKKAFDSVEHQIVLNALNTQTISPAYIRMLDQIFGLGTSNIKLHTNTNKIRLEKGTDQPQVRRRCSPVLGAPQELQLMVDKLRIASNKVGLEINLNPHEIKWFTTLTPKSCDYLCNNPYAGQAFDPGCCDFNAKCTCGLVSGLYNCVCGPGYFGESGLKGDCKLCPIGTYKDDFEPTYRCKRCPRKSTTGSEGGSSLADCHCIKGYIGNPAAKKTCRIRKCPPLQEPAHGKIIGKCRQSYKSTCYFSCGLGYKVSRFESQERTCQADGTWSGTTTVCEKIRCPNLETPKFGEKQCTNKENPFGTVCKFKCSAGFIILGTKSRMCGPGGLWSGYEPECQIVTCPVLKKLRNGRITPPSCIIDRTDFSGTCFFQCFRGFSLIGPKYMICNKRGLWEGTSANTKVTPYCKDIEKPRIQCQPAIMVKSELGSDFAWVEWTAPSVWDNSGFAPKIESNPYYQKNKAKFKIGKHKITYKVTDASLLTSVCDVHITVLDREPPRVIFCPNDFTVNTTELEEPIFWKEPIFEDNSKSNLKIHASYRPGERFQVGKWLIYYLATDKSGNDATCEFNVIVSKNTCPYHPAPVNGALTCSDWLRGEFCQVYCNRKFDFAQKPAKWYVCDRKSVWKTIPTNSPVPWPDCSEWYIPRAMRKLVGHYFTGNCSDERVQSRMKERFLAYFKDKFDQSMYCKGEKSCKVESVKIKCGKHNTSIARLRGKRDTRPVEDLMEIELEFVVEAYSKVALFYSSGKVAKSRSTSTLQLCLLCRLILRSLQDPVILTLLTFVKHLFNHENNQIWLRKRPDSAVSSRIRSDYPVLNPILIRRDVQKKSVIKELVSAANGLLSVNELKDNALKNEIESNVIGSRQIELKTENTLLVCGIGQVKRKDECVNCPVGTFFNKNTKNCQICPTGQYQNNEAQLLCLRCPRGTWTVGNHNKNFTECKGICQEGTFSKTGLESCSACPRGTFQNMPGKSDCTTCPKHTTTWTVQAKNSSFCREKCLPGSFSDTGLQHCLPCSIGYYQDRYGQQHCVECPKNLSTKKKGSVSRTACVAINHCETNACKNGGTCHNLKHSFSCSCSEGFHGYRCDNETDECISSPCEQNSTCIDKVADFECVCSKGFSGKTCEVEINECLLFPCQNGGTCIDKVCLVAGYQCFCLNGYSGDRCEVDLDLCENNPCGQQGKCTDLGESIKCDCKPGFEGEICQTNINDCADVTCLNDGRRKICCQVSINPLCVLSLPAKSDGQQCACVSSAQRVYYFVRIWQTFCVHIMRLKFHHTLQPDIDGHTIGQHCAQFEGNLTTLTVYFGSLKFGKIWKWGVFHWEILATTVQVYPNRAVIRNLRAFVEGYTPRFCASQLGTCGHSSVFILLRRLGINGYKLAYNFYKSDSYILSTQHELVRVFLTISYKSNFLFHRPAYACRLAEGQHVTGGARFRLRARFRPLSPICKDGINSHSCVCPLGFAGNKCEINIDDCIKNNCKNDATCTDLLNNYKCNCKPGFSGIKCEKGKLFSRKMSVTHIKGILHSLGVKKKNSQSIWSIPLKQVDTNQLHPIISELSANFMMTFKEPRLSNYAIWTDMPTLSEFTIDAWIQSEFHQKQSGTILSYATIHSNTTVLDNALTITDLSNVKIFVNNNPIYTDLEMDDGKWHRLTVTWSSVKEGSWRVIFDGTKVVEGKHLSENEPIPGGGILVLGQDQDAVGGNFNIMESFIGNLSRCVEFIYDVFFDLSGSLLPSNLRVKISSEFRFTLHIRMDKDGYSVAPKGAEIWANLHFRMLILIPHRLKVDSSLQSAAESDEDSDNEMDTHTPMDTITPKMAQPYYDLFHDDTENEDFDGFESDEDRV